MFLIKEKTKQIFILQNFIFLSITNFNLADPPYRKSSENDITHEGKDVLAFLKLKYILFYDYTE